MHVQDFIHQQIRKSERERIAKFLRQRAKAVDAYPHAHMALLACADCVEANVLPILEVDE